MSKATWVRPGPASSSFVLSSFWVRKIGPLIKIATIMAKKPPTPHTSKLSRPHSHQSPARLATPSYHLLLSPCSSRFVLFRLTFHFGFMAERKANIAIAVQHGNGKNGQQDMQDFEEWEWKWGWWLVGCEKDLSSTIESLF